MAKCKLLHSISMFIGVFFSPIMLLGAPVSSNFKTYELDASHTRVGFEIDHLVIATVEGRFNEFTGSFEYDDKAQSLRNAKIEIKAASIDTNEADRDKHLRSPDFFDVAKYPTITLDDIKLSSAAGKPSKLDGTITMHGVKKPLSFAVNFKGTAVDPWGNAKMVFELAGELNRKEFGLLWNKSLDKGGVMIGDKVKLVIRVEAQVRKR